jgi:[acyl-carrier-protein] S-malonyltransferase
MTRQDIGVVFPGQGAQAVGMGADLAAARPTGRAVFDRASEVLEVDLARVCFEGPAEELNRTDIAQPALLVCSLAFLAVLEEEGVVPADHAGYGCTAGLSLGEYTALVFAGSLDFEDAVRLVRRRGELMQEASDRVPSTMVATIGMDPDVVAGLCDRAREDGVLTVANLNAPGQVVVSGDVVACDRFEALVAAEDQGTTRRLAVAGAFHSDRMAPAAEGLAAAVAEVEVRPPRVPFLSNVTADLVDDPAEIRRLLAAQLVSPVRWQASMERAVALGVTRLLEIGAGRVLAGLQRKIDRSVKVTSYNKLSAVQG